MRFFLLILVSPIAAGLRAFTGLRAQLAGAGAFIYPLTFGLRLKFGDDDGAMISYNSIAVENVQRTNDTYSIDIRHLEMPMVWQFSAIDKEAWPMLLELLRSKDVSITEATDSITEALSLLQPS